MIGQSDFKLHIVRGDNFKHGILTTYWITKDMKIKEENSQKEYLLTLSLSTQNANEITILMKSLDNLDMKLKA
jgi:hypothetical protein